jgi:hypothetical protein
VAARDREMDAVGRDRSRFVLMAQQLLLLPVNEWERKFLNRLIHGDEEGPPPQRLSKRMAETLFEIRDEYELHSTLFGGFSVSTLIQRVYDARADLSSEDDQGWITEVRNSGVNQLRRAGCGRLRRCAAELYLIEPYMDVA